MQKVIIMALKVANTFKWLSSFLRSCLQRVVLNVTSSHWTQMKSGVPQGLVLGALLFILYINDLPDDVTCGIKLFAHDTKIYFIVKDVSDTLLLQKNLDMINHAMIPQMAHKIQS